MDINKFLKDYYDICKKHNIQLVATGFTESSLDIADLSDDVLNTNNIYALDVDVDFDNNKVSYWNKDNNLIKINLNDL